MNNSNQVRHFILNGSVQTSGGVENLADGTFALVDRKEPQTGTGLQAIASLQTKPKNQKRFILTVGELKHAKTRTSDSGDSQSVPFAVEDVVEIVAIPPVVTTSQVDEWAIGFNGHDPKTSFKFKQGMAPLKIDMKLEGGSLPFSAGGNFSERIEFVYDFNKSNAYLACDTTELCEPIACQAIIKDIVEQMRRYPVGSRKLGEMIDIMAISSCGTGLGETPFTTWKLKVCDAGDNTSLARVQNGVQLPVKRVARQGSMSVYQIFKAGDNSATPTAFVPSYGGTFPECSICPDGESPDKTKGYLYQFLIEDNGQDRSTVITGAVGSTTVERLGQDYGKGSYLVSNDTVLTTAQIGSIATALGVANLSFTFDFLGELKAICEGGTETPIAWVAGETCYGSSETYQITLPDTECGENRLAELAARYPKNNVELATGDNASVVATFDTGTAALNVISNGVTYTEAWDTDEGTTVTNFIATNEAAMLAEGLVISKVGDTLKIEGATAKINALTVTGSFTKGEVTNIPNGEGCQHTYTMVIPSNVVCEECDDVFLDSYHTEKPEHYDENVWTKVEGETAVGDCNCGIRLKSKLYKNVPPIEQIYDLPYIEDSIKISVAASGYATEGYMAGVAEWTEEVAKTRLSHKRNRSHVAGNLFCKEKESYLYFQDKSLDKNYLKRQWYGKATRFSDLEAQYVNYIVKVRRNTKSGYLNQLTGKEISYNFYVEFGRHKELEAVLNEMASAAGLSGVQISK